MWTIGHEYVQQPIDKFMKNTQSSSRRFDLLDDFESFSKVVRFYRFLFKVNSSPLFDLCQKKYGRLHRFFFSFSASLNNIAFFISNFHTLFNLIDK